MAKKRQQDFAKTSLKPGRPIAKRKNITNTSFKAKKITMPSKSSRQAIQSKTIPSCLEIIKKDSHNSVKLKALDELNKLITKDCLPSYLTEMLELLLKLFLDTEDSIRNATTTVLEKILQSTSDLQLQSFVSLLINTLSIAMIHPNMRVKENSLKLLAAIMKLHPDLLCHSMTLLNHLFEMLHGIPRTRTHTQTPKQNLSIMYSDGIYSPHWRIHLLGHINCFLKGMIKKKSALINEKHDEQEVYWDSESQLYLPIYAGSGLKPFDVEKCYSNFISTEEFCDDSNMLLFIDNILQIFPAIFTEEMALPKCDDQLLDAWTISSLNILFQVLISISDWLKLLASADMDKVIGTFLKDNIHEKARFPFKSRGAVVVREEETIECIELNLSVCYLYCTYLLELVECKQSLCNSIFSYVRAVFTMSEEVQLHSVPILVKLLKIFFGMRETIDASDFLYDVLFKLCFLLSEKHPNRQLLTALFAKMSLDPAYQFLAETEAMMNWFKWLLRMLSNLKTLDKNLLPVIRKIANRRYPSFQKLLMQIDFSVFKAMLKHNDEDIWNTAIFLLYNMEDINAELLDNIAHVILTEPKLPKKLAVRLIRLLTYRFSEKPHLGNIPKVSMYNEEKLLDIVQFLLNIAIDSFNIYHKKFIDYEANKYTKSLNVIRDFVPYGIIPSLQWKEHEVLFKVCDRCLNEFPGKIVNIVACNLFREILDKCTVLPMHTVISIFKIHRQDMEEYYEEQIYKLRCSALLTASVLTYKSTIDDNDWYQYNIKELTESMNLRNDITFEILRYYVECIREDELEGMVAFYILRVCSFLLEMNLMDPESFQEGLGVIEVIKEMCIDKTIAQQPAFLYLYNTFNMC